MTSSGRGFARPLTSPFAKTSTFYLVLFYSIGSSSPFFALWFKSIGITETQVGIIAASPSFAMILTTFFIGGLADKASDWRSVIIGCNWLAALLTTGLFLWQSFIGVLVIWTLVGILMMAMSPILDAAAVRMAKHQNTQFHQMRAFGSAGFIVGVLFSGVMFERFGIGYFILVLSGLAWGRAVISHALPQFKAGMRPVVQPVAPDTSATRTCRQPWFLLVLFASALIHASHAYFYTFGTIMWVEAGYSTRFVSVLWALGVIIEVIVMWKFAALATRFSARILLISAGAIASIRWMLFGFQPDSTLLVLAQALHGLTFALMFLATINFIANWTPVAIAARAQTLSASVNTGCMALMTLASGYLHVSLIEKGYWVMATSCLLATLLIAYSFRLSPERAGYQQRC